MKYLIVDASLNGTGVRDAVNGGYISLETLSIPNELKERIGVWLQEYEDEHYNNYEDKENVKLLDSEGKEIAKKLKQSLTESKIEYYSSGNLSKEII